MGAAAAPSGAQSHLWCHKALVLIWNVAGSSAQSLDTAGYESSGSFALSASDFLEEGAIQTESDPCALGLTVLSVFCVFWASELQCIMRLFLEKQYRAALIQDLKHCVRRARRT